MTLLNKIQTVTVGQVSMAAAGAWSTEGGNFRIFEEFAKRSGANIHLNTRVLSIRNSTEIDDQGNAVGRYLLATDKDENQVFDAVIIATPLVLSFYYLQNWHGMD